MDSSFVKLLKDGTLLIDKDLFKTKDLKNLIDVMNEQQLKFIVNRVYIDVKIFNLKINYRDILSMIYNEYSTNMEETIDQDIDIFAFVKENRHVEYFELMLYFYRYDISNYDYRYISYIISRQPELFNNMHYKVCSFGTDDTHILNKLFDSASYSKIKLKMTFSIGVVFNALNDRFCSIDLFQFVIDNYKKMPEDEKDYTPYNFSFYSDLSAIKSGMFIDRFICCNFDFIEKLCILNTGVHVVRYIHNKVISGQYPDFECQVYKLLYLSPWRNYI